MESCQIDIHSNEYMDSSKKGKVPLSEYYKNSDLLSGVAEGGDWCVFQGECPIDKDTGIDPEGKSCA